MITGIFYLLVIASFLLSIGLYKKDYAIQFLSASLFILCGFTSMNNGFMDIPNMNFAIGIVFIFMGFYVIYRCAAETIEMLLKLRK